ncbi:hypothetical protein L228DRAFT_230743 [Xylona heveae TC161]|uniref:Dolichyl-diphosphooligosaccharide--protein glycosyltransferase subunit 1 n=1 Tax=Xylona heveae (strain CBS 132557 / TC161) TaxID=1328760 RepID=A0A165GLL2_XYLHT|nr:hypothetical protein L228DRAFT_230743 [Xylona heveae TC161]KZF22341.1 hypothetical protein L228DRAFT_230743 [Xylona heveae TC161]
MRSLLLATAVLSVFAPNICSAEPNVTTPLSSRQILPSTFKPPQVFQNVNLLRNINLEKSYVKQSVNVVIENTDSNPQDEYYVPFEADVMANVGSFDVKDKKDPEKGSFEVEAIEFDTYSPTQFFRVRLPEPLKPSTRLTLAISYTVLDALQPLPATIEQTDKQYLQYTFNAYSSSVYPTQKQMTKLKLPTSDVPDYTVLPGEDNKEFPEKQGSSFTYGPFGSVPAGAAEPVSVRYEFTKPLIHATLLERDIEVSHWGGNLATEERYWLVNNAAQLSKNFNRVTWQATQYYSPPTAALKMLTVPLRAGSEDAYFTDDIGNVSTSRFRSNSRESLLELRPRYPMFGGWKYSFRIGWNGNLAKYVRKLSAGDTYVLKVPFLEGPKQNEGIEYERVEVKVILPEGAKNVKYETSIPVSSVEQSLHRTFMDTLGRTTLAFTALNVVDQARSEDLIITYDYPFTAGLRKPLTLVFGMLAVFTIAWALGQLDTSIAAGKNNVFKSSSSSSSSPSSSPSGPSASSARASSKPHSASSGQSTPVSKGATTSSTAGASG